MRTLVKGGGMKDTEKNPEMDDKIRKELNSFYIGDAKKLKKLIGKDLSVWYKK